MAKATQTQTVTDTHAARDAELRVLIERRDAAVAAREALFRQAEDSDPAVHLQATKRRIAAANEAVNLAEADLAVFAARERQEREQWQREQEPRALEQYLALVGKVWPALQPAIEAHVAAANCRSYWAERGVTLPDLQLHALDARTYVPGAGLRESQLEMWRDECERLGVKA